MLSRRISWLCVLASMAISALLASAQKADLEFLNHNKPVLDAHNCYPYDGQWNNRVQRALASGFPVSIEQDLAWYVDPATGKGRVVVSHSKNATGLEPALRDYFFEQVRPVVERALAENKRDQWPLIVLHFDFKDTQPAILEAVWQLLGEYESWLSTAPKTDDPDTLSPIERRPILAITEESDDQAKVFFDNVPVGGKLRVFGSAHSNRMPGSSGTPSSGATSPSPEIQQARMHWIATAAPEQLLSAAPTNYRRWWNNSWYPVEEGGQAHGGDWTGADDQRLRALVNHAHLLGYWIRFYTLDGFAPADDQGWGKYYNFGSRDAVVARWKAAAAADVDFIATDQYEDLAPYLQQRAKNLRPSSATAAKQ